MRLRIGLVKLIIVIVALSMLSVPMAYAAEKTATVTLYPYPSASGTVPGDAKIGTITIVSTTGPTGGTTVSVTVNNTIDGDTYTLSYGRDGQSFRIVGFVSFIYGNGGTVTIDGIQLDKAPTNGQRFELADDSADQVVAISDPIKY